MSDNRPVWLLDIDGVINAISKKPDINTWPEESWKTTTGYADSLQWPILYSTGVVDFLNEIHERVDIRWHTTWQQDAPVLGHQIGLPVFPVAPAPEFWSRSISDYWWKIGAAERVVREEVRPLIWTDDDLHYESFHVAHLLPGNCFVSPPSMTGLLKKHLNQIEEWLDALGS